jgi:hypothetical protein
MKKCKICNLEKDYDEFYNHPKTKDGYSQKCKVCTKEESNKRYDKLKQDPEFLQKERKRGREKQQKYKYKNSLSSDRIKEVNDTYRKNFPEKYKAHCCASKLPKKEGHHLHHWSYNEEHRLDVIEISAKHHKKAHRFIIYDQERMMYRTLNNILLDTRKTHEEYINTMIETQED